MFGFFLLPFLVLLLVYGTIIFFFAGYAGRQVRSELVRIATDHRNLINQFLNEKAAMLRFVVDAFTPQTLGDRNTLEAVLDKLQAESKAFFDLGVFDENGQHLAYTGPFDLVGRSYAQAEWFKAIQNQDVYISDEFLGYRRIPHFIVVVRGREDDRNWFLRATIDTYYFNELVESIRIGQTGEAYIINAAGILQTRKRSGGHIMGADPDYADYRTGRIDDAVFFQSGNLASRYLYATATIQRTGWIVIVRQSMTDAYAQVAYAVILSFLILLGGGGMVVVMGFFMASKVASRLRLADMERREMKTQLILAGKMAEVGEMSTGIAHEINNPLQVMKSEVAMIASILKDIGASAGEKEALQLDLLAESADEIGTQIDRCSKITQGLLNFARKNEGVTESVNLQAFIPKMVALVDQRARLENIRIIQTMEENLPEITCDANQLQQVFLNLFNNAIYALRGRKGAEIRVGVRQEGQAVVVVVADNGCGFSPEEMEKAFVPFYTTKPVGQGTGLGLSTVYGIIKGMGGDISLTSEQGGGSAFSIHLPIHTPVTPATVL